MVHNITDRQKAAAQFFNDKHSLVGWPLLHAVMMHNRTQQDAINMLLKTHLAAHDALIVVWTEKAKYDAVRPFSAIKYLYGDQPIKGYSKKLKKPVDDMPAMNGTVTLR